MKTIRKMRGLLALLLLGWASAGHAQYPAAPQITTSGSAAYTPIATAINSWKDAWTAGTNASNNNNDAFTHRSTIIDQVEATLVAAGKATITDAEYDVLADALYFWLHRVADEGARQSNTGGHYNNRAGWYISGIGIPEHFFGKYSTTEDYNNSQCVWELTNPNCVIGGGGGNGYGPMLGSNTRLVLVTNQTEVNIKRASTKCNVMFSTNGENSKLLVVGRKNHKINFHGGKSFADVNSYSEVLNRAEEYTSTNGNAVIINGGSLLTAYTGFVQNVATADSCKYREYTKIRHDTVNAQGQLCGGKLVRMTEGGAVGVLGKVNQVALYKTEFKNNAHNVKQIGNFGGAMCLRYVESIVDGVYMNKCSIKGNYTKGHGGGLSGYFDGGVPTEKMIIRDTEFAYNCQAGADERHGGGIFYRDTGRQTELYNCTFTNNYAHGATAGGAGISTEGHLLLQNCSFDRNYSDNAFGGAIYTRPVFDGGIKTKVVDLKIDGCSFTNNECTWTHYNDSVNVSMQSSNIERGSGGAIMVDIFHGTSDADTTTYDISVDIYGNSVFTNNTADRNGGAIAVVMMGDMKLWSATHANQITSNLKITSATINGNHVTDKDVPVFTYTSDAGSVQGVTKNGGAIYLAHTTLTMEGGTIGSQSAPNYATLGGGAYVNDANFYLKGGTLSYNNATTGGGAYIQTGNVEQSGGSISHNTSVDNGGGIYIANGSYKMTEADATSAVNDNTANANGGGIYVANGSVTVEQGAFDGNNAVMDGGGFYITGNTSSVDITGGEIKNNSATQNGGGFAVEGGTVNISQTNTAYPTLITNNNATQNGGGFWVDVASTTDTTFITGGSTVANNTAINGGGAYINKGRLVIQDAATNLTSNTAGTSGGGIYMANGTVTVTNAMVQTNAATGGNGGGLYVGNGDITLSGAKVSGNSATNGQGGGIYAGNGNIQVKDGTQVGTYSAKVGSGNSAKEGGGLYVNGGTVVFTDGTFADNQASEKGGGIYIKDGATLNLRETATITRNHVPATGQGGGVYMNGTLNVGENATDPATKHAIIVRDNYAGSAYSLATRNNVFLPSTTKYITLLSDIHASASKVGFSVTQGFCPVIYTDIEGGNASHEQWLYDLMGGTSGLTGAIFDDAQKYFALHVRTDQGPFEAKYDYLWGAWTTHVYHNPNEHLDEYPLPTGVSTHFTEESDGWHIYTKEGLAWFISYVNGLNNAGEHRNANAFLENDVDMSGHLWVPIGGTVSFDSEQGIFADGGYYNGHFDGKGHVISNLDCRYMNAVLKIGLFGKVTGGSVTNTFVDGYQFLTQFSDKAYYLGGIAGWATGGTISNCEARGLMETEFCEGSESYMGGLVGKLEGATVHSSMAMPTMTGIAQHMGGLAGYVASSNTLKNSFSNAEITRGSNNSQIGGLAGTNSGTIENCYVRLRGTEPANFGWFAGSNGGSIQYCYALDGHTNYVNTGTAPVGSGNYAPTALEGGKYGYAHQDQEVTATNTYVENGAIDNQGELKGLLATLNNWVEAQPATAGYSTWTRTMASPINDDLPILEFNDFVSAGSTDNVFIAYRDDLNDMIDYANANSTGGSVYLYDVPGTVTVANNANVKIFVNEHIGFLQSVSLQNVRTGITLDNSSSGFMSYDWHMFSPALTNAPMGLTYNSMVSDYPIYSNYSNYKANGIPESVYSSNAMNPRATAWNTNAGTIGYFPTNTPYGAPHDNRGCFDFYCYSEEYTHWVNFKREGMRSPEFFDHWRQNADENGNHQNIPYENESNMVRGKGYMVAIDKTSMLMTDGSLDNNQVTVPVTNTTSLTGYEAPLKGVNLIGNPYQAYLDFNQIGNNLNTYFVLDADAKGYIAYVSGGSTPTQSGVINCNAPQILHPHQGFFVRVPQGTRNITLNNTMILAGKGTSTFRSEANHYPMVTLAVEDGRGRRDYTTVELDRPETGGGEKIQGLHAGDASLWVRHDDTDWQVAFTKPGTREVPVRFKAYQDGTFTLSWGAYNGYFSYLHLIDNLTGADIDCLQADEYRFEATTHDYTSRFRLVFEFTGVEENDEPTEGPTSFAFMMGDELVINGEGVLQMFDLNGRQLFSTEIHGTQNSVAMPKVADGIYVLRLTNGNQVRTQKMVINK